MAETQKTMTKKETLLINLSNFLNKNRFIFIIVLAVIIVGLISFAVAREVISKRNENAAGLAETSQQLYQDWVTAVDDTEKENIKTELENSLEKIHNEYPKFFAAARAYFIEGNMLFEEENWTESAKTYVNIADNFPDTYLAPIGLNNAAVAYENGEDVENAILVMERLRAEYQDTYPDMPRILFNLGRLYEIEEEWENAKEAYNAMIDNFPAENWTKLARNRIIQLTID